jgi:hypothetical protein
MLMGYWVDLYTGGDKEALYEGINTMLMIAARLMGKRKKNDDLKLLENNQDSK